RVREAVPPSPGWSRSRRLSGAGLAVAALGAFGCSTPVVDDIADANGGMTQGIVLVERTAEADGSTQTNVSAKFMRMAVAADHTVAERVVGSQLDLPAVGRCPVASAEGAEPATPSLAALGSIELIDVGDVTIR